MTQRRSQHGFTLTEVMVVVAIIALISAFMIGLRSTPYSGNPRSSSQMLASMFNECKQRSVQTRRWHRCEVKPTMVTMYQWSATGMTAPSGACSPPSTNCWQLITQTTLDKNVVVWDAQPGAETDPGTMTVASSANPSLATTPLNIDFKPDGSSTGGTVFLSDTFGNYPNRTIVYNITGGSYARQGW